MMASETTARGTIVLVLSKALFLVGSVLIHVFLGRYLGPEGYGQYGLVMSILLWFEVVVSSAVPWAVSKVISERKLLARHVFLQGIGIQLIFSMTVLAVFVLLTPTLARVFGDAAIRILLWWVALDIPFFALLSIVLTYYNGLQRFGRQGMVSISRILFKVLATILLVMGGYAIKGALVANIVASLLALITGLFLLRLPSPSTHRVRLVRRVLSFGVPYTLYLLSAQLLLSLDLWSVKILVDDPAAAGFYTSAQTISRVPYFLFLGLTTALFPALSHSVSSGQEEASRVQVRQAMRLQALILLPTGAIVCASPDAVVRLFFGADFQPAVGPLAVLIWGMILFTCYYNLAVILSVIGRPLAAVGFSLIFILGDGLLNWLLVPRMGTTGAALATLFTSVSGTVVLAVVVSRRFGTLLSRHTLFKLAVATGLVFWLSARMPWGGVLLILEGLVLLAIFMGIMVALREVQRKDFDRLKALWPSSLRWPRREVW
jgi:O-antigen/teichoic acid export membrane protein